LLKSNWGASSKVASFKLRVRRREAGEATVIKFIAWEYDGRTANGWMINDSPAT
jgi:hypothetical protein